MGEARFLSDQHSHCTIFPFKMLFSAASLFLCCQVALGGILSRDTPIPPAQDPFYRAPAGYEDAAPGTILNSRPAPDRLAILNTIPVNIKEVTQLLYRTNNCYGTGECELRQSRFIPG